MSNDGNKPPTIYLDRNESQFGPAPECFTVLKQVSRNELSNYSRDFVRGVKSILSETLARTYELPEPNVLLSYGSEDMLKQIVHCYLTPNEAMMIPQHSWWYYKSVAGEVNGRVVEYPMHSDKERFSYDLKEIVELVRTVKPRLLLFASPNNPTGNSLSAADVEFLLDKCPETMFIIDEAYFGFSNTPHHILPQLTRRYAHLAVLRTFSKLYALAGIRIGYAFVGKNYDKLTMFSARYLGYNLISEQLALAALGNANYYRTLAATIAKERERYYDFFKKVDGCRAYKTDANFVLVKLPHGVVEPLKKDLLSEGLVIKFFSEKEFPDHARITIGTQEQNTLLLGAMKKSFERNTALVSEHG